MLRPLTTFLLVLAMLAVAVGCGDSSDEAATEPTTAERPVETLTPSDEKSGEKAADRKADNRAAAKPGSEREVRRSQGDHKGKPKPATPRSGAEVGPESPIVQRLLKGNLEKGKGGKESESPEQVLQRLLGKGAGTDEGPAGDGQPPVGDPAQEVLEQLLEDR